MGINIEGAVTPVSYWKEQTERARREATLITPPHFFTRLWHKHQTETLTATTLAFLALIGVALSKVHAESSSNQAPAPTSVETMVFPENQAQDIIVYQTALKKYLKADYDPNFWSLIQNPNFLKDYLKVKLVPTTPTDPLSAPTHPSRQEADSAILQVSLPSTGGPKVISQKNPRGLLVGLSAVVGKDGQFVDKGKNGTFANPNQLKDLAKQILNLRPDNWADKLSEDGRKVLGITGTVKQGEINVTVNLFYSGIINVEPSYARDTQSTEAASSIPTFH